MAGGLKLRLDALPWPAWRRRANSHMIAAAECAAQCPAQIPIDAEVS